MKLNPSNLQKAILLLVRQEERVDQDYRASTKFIIESLSDFNSNIVGSAIEDLVDREQLLKGREYPPRDGETFKFYVYLTLTIKGQDHVSELTRSSLPSERSLFD